MNTRSSPAAQRIRAFASGLAPSLRARKRLFMLQIFTDDSQNEDPSVFVVAGYVATVDQWEKFSEAWDHALRGWHIPYFKMSEVQDQWSEEILRERVAYLYSIINDHVSGAFSSIVEPPLLKKVMKGLPDASLQNPYILSFLHLISQVTRVLVPKIDPEDDIEFIFDEQTERKLIRKRWDQFLAGAPAEAKRRIAREPIFANDQKYLPLQAADLFAWWRRRRYLETFHGQAKMEFPGKPRRQQIPTIGTIWTEEKLIQARTVFIAHAAGLTNPALRPAIRYDVNGIGEINLAPGLSLKWGDPPESE